MINLMLKLNLSALDPIMALLIKVVKIQDLSLERANAKVIKIKKICLIYKQH